MENELFLSELYELESLLQKFINAGTELGEAEKALNRAKVGFPSRLQAFDDAHREAYIRSEIGTEPEKKIFQTKAKLTQKQEEYASMLSFAEKNYDRHFRDEREKLRAQDESDRQEAVEQATVRLKEAEEAYQKLKVLVDSNGTLHEKFKCLPTVRQLIEYVREGRADTKKEAINLWYEEKRRKEEAEAEAAHRAKMEEYANRIAEVTEMTRDGVREVQSTVNDILYHTR